MGHHARPLGEGQHTEGLRAQRSRRGADVDPAAPAFATPLPLRGMIKQQVASYLDFLSLASEPLRATIEATDLLVSYPSLLPASPVGDGHSVLVLPGFAASDLYTCSLRAYLNALGYIAKPWRLGRNLGRPSTLSQVAQRLEKLHDRVKQPISIVGHSLGGVYARELARAHPEWVRQVITLGSPFAMNADQPSSPTLARLYQRLQLSDERFDPPPVPTTSIYSKDDGVVNWRHCLEQSSRSTQNVEVRSSHLGMTVHPAVLYVLADRLAQRQQEWRPFG